MPNADALLEICTELCLLSRISNHVIDQSVLHDQADLASLFYGLRAVSYQAKQLITAHFPEYQAVLQDKESGDILADEGKTGGQREVTKLPANRSQGRHDWIAEVLFDIGKYARENQLLELCTEVEKLRVSFAAQIKTSGPMSFGGVTLEGAAASYTSFWGPKNCSRPVASELRARLGERSWTSTFGSQKPTHAGK